MSSLRAKAEAAAEDITARMDCVIDRDEGDEARKMIADAIVKLAREFAEDAVRDVVGDRNHFSGGYMTPEVHEDYIAGMIAAAKGDDQI